MIKNIVLFRNKLNSGLKVYHELLLALLGSVIIFIIGMYRVSEIGQPILFNDEYGYWAGSAYLMGDDWSSVTSRIPYYSYGYGIFLSIVRMFGRVFGWEWGTLYQAAIVMHLLMLCASYFIALKLCKRYFPVISTAVRYILCIAVIVYPSNLVLSHVTLSESTLTFLFWLFLLVMMYATDKPTVANHIMLAIMSVLLYAVHQRTLAVLLSSVLVVIYMDLRKRNQWIHTISFGTALFVALCIHGVLKKGLQNDFYRGNPSLGFSGVLGTIFSAKTFVLLILFAGVGILLGLCRKGRKKQAAMITAGGMGVCLLLLVIFGGVLLSAKSGSDKISMNDFAGQIYKIQGLFTWQGLARFGISIVGKLFYFASGTALIILWGIKDLLLHFFRMCVDAFKALKAVFKEEPYTSEKVMNEKASEDLWLFGVFVASAGTFLICALYKEGLYKVDDLVHGRYIEFLVGILLLYSFNSLLQDKHWIRNAIIFYVIYSLSGVLSQYVLNELKRNSFELCHSVMFGRIFWNWEVPVGKVKVVAGYALPAALAIILLVKPKIGFIKEKWCSVFSQGRLAAALLIPIVVWTMLSYSIIDNYVVARNVKQTKSMDQIAFWVDALDKTIPVYYLEDTENYRWAESLQFMLQDRIVTMTTTTEADYGENAFFVMDNAYARSEAVQEKGQIIITSGQFTLVASRESEAIERYQEIKSRYE